MKFSHKLLLLFGIFVLFIGVILSFYIYTVSKASLEREITNRLEMETQEIMLRIDILMHEKYSDIQVMATGSLITNHDSNPEDITKRLIEYRNFYKSYASISLFDINRTRIADTSGLMIGEQHELIGYWRGVLDGKIVSGSDIRVAEELKAPIIYFAAPVKDKDGNVFRVIVARVPITKINNVLLKGVLDNDVDLLNKEGATLYSSHGSGDLFMETSHMWNQLNEKSKGKEIGSYVEFIEGTESIVAFAKEPGYLDFEGNNWIVTYAIPTKEAFALASKLLYALISVLVSVFIVFSIAIFYLSRSMLRPLNQLYIVTKEIERGNLKARTNIKTGDEFEELGNVFNNTIEQMEKTDEQRKQVDKAKTEFLSITSHELRSPMTPMKAQLQMVLGDYFGKLTKEQRESLQIVLNNTERLDKIIQDFLEISRIEAARLKFEFVKTSLNEPIKRTIEEMKGFMPEKKIKIEPYIDSLPVIEVDSDRVMQVLRNLLNNAIKFSKDNGKIEVYAKKEKDFIYFTVKDYGDGIADEEQGRIFEPFFQAGGMYARKFGGTGLGLAICKGIVESQNGKIWFESKKGVGTVFHFAVPLEPVREMRPIKILFSGRADIEKEVKELLIDILGPLGISEFYNLQKQGITEERVIKYLESLKKDRIVTERFEEFKKRIKLIFEGEKKEGRQAKAGKKTRSYLLVK
ncbi:sensor histidine kinase [Candidatus Pacearchaeota archaeon]|nr:sensor histidine kinase [Candidatus Pacearchaeota archaeon]